MEISIRGKTECLTKTEIRKIFDFLCKYFLGKRLSKYIFIEVEFKSLNTVFGLCEPTDYDYKNHREFNIQIEKNMTRDRKSTRLNSSHIPLSRMPSSA